MTNLKILLSIFSLIILFATGIAYLPKGSDYIQYEKNMIESGQMKAANSEYFSK